MLEVALRVTETRNKAGLSQTELAEIAGVTQQQVSKLERGLNCNVLTMLKVLQALHLKVKVQTIRVKAA